MNANQTHNEDIHKIYSANYWKAVPLNEATSSLDPEPRAIYVGTGGNLACSGLDDVEAIFKNIPDGAVLPIQPRTIQSGSTTCDDIIALY